MTSVLGFWSVVLTLGTGLAVDLTIATLSRFHDRTLTFTNWALALGLTHLLFPALSFWGFKHFTNSQFILGIIGFVLISMVVHEILSEALGHKPKFSLSNWIGRLFNGGKKFGRKVVLVLSVSWDALLCGPALIANNWTDFQAVMAFLSFGTVALFVAVCFLKVNRIWRQTDFHDIQKLSLINYRGTFWELVVISSFGIASLLFAFTGISSWLLSLTLSFLIFNTLFMLNEEKLRMQTMIEAREAIGD